MGTIKQAIFNLKGGSQGEINLQTALVWAWSVTGPKWQIIWMRRGKK